MKTIQIPNKMPRTQGEKVKLRFPTIFIFQEHWSSIALDLSICHYGNPIAKLVGFGHAMCWQDYSATLLLALQNVPYLFTCFYIHSRCRFIQDHKLQSVKYRKHKHNLQAEKWLAIDDKHQTWFRTNFSNYIGKEKKE